MGITLHLNVAAEPLGASCYDNTQSHILVVKSIEDIETLKECDYRTGYPEKFRF